MEPWVWTTEFSVGIGQLDEDHKKIIENIALLQAAMTAQKGREQQKDSLDQMLRYAAVHFAREEKYMKEFKFVGAREHKAEHKKFVAKTLELQNRFKRAGFVLTMEVLAFLRQWWQEHVLTMDRKYIKCFKENGL